MYYVKLSIFNVNAPQNTPPGYITGTPYHLTVYSSDYQPDNSMPWSIFASTPGIQGVLGCTRWDLTGDLNAIPQSNWTCAANSQHITVFQNNPNGQVSSDPGCLGVITVASFDYGGTQHSVSTSPSPMNSQQLLWVAVNVQDIANQNFEFFSIYIGASPPAPAPGFSPYSTNSLPYQQFP